jgi:enoyl-[acyl-carrier protein] reductase II
MLEKSITKLFSIRYPIIQGGMVWVSGGKLAAAVSEHGGLGLIGAGSMKPELLREHIIKAQKLTKNPFGVNVPLLYEKAQEQIDTALELGIKIFFTSAGSPKTYTQYLKDKGCIVVHVTSSPELAKKCEDAGVDAIVAEGFEAGGHNGRDEITTMALIPQVRAAVKIPVIAAGGFASGESIVAAFALGADGVQMGTRFLMTKESSAHDDFKNYALKSMPGSTKLTMKKIVPVRLLHNSFSEEVLKIEDQYLGSELRHQLLHHLGKGRAKKGMLEGDVENGELEVGQIISQIKNIPTVEEVIRELVQSYEQTLQRIPKKL